MKVIVWLLIIVVAIAGVLLNSAQTEKAAAKKVQDDQAQEIQTLKSRLDGIERTPPPAQHHYEFRENGERTWRFDPATGGACIQLASKQDWKTPDIIRQGCQYQDWVNAPGANAQTYKDAECLLVDPKKCGT